MGETSFETFFFWRHKLHKLPSKSNERRQVGKKRKRKKTLAFPVITSALPPRLLFGKFRQVLDLGGFGKPVKISCCQLIGGGIASYERHLALFLKQKLKHFRFPTEEQKKVVPFFLPSLF